MWNQIAARSAAAESWSTPSTRRRQGSVAISTQNATVSVLASLLLSVPRHRPSVDIPPRATKYLTAARWPSAAPRRNASYCHNHRAHLRARVEQLPELDDVAVPGRLLASHVYEIVGDGTLVLDARRPPNRAVPSRYSTTDHTAGLRIPIGVPPHRCSLFTGADTLKTCVEINQCVGCTRYHVISRR